MVKIGRQAKIAIGMDRSDAAKLLRGADAKATRLDGSPPQASTDNSGVAYEIPTGGLLIVDYNRASTVASYRVSGLRLCVDPNVPKAKRVWKDLSMVTV